MKQSSMERSTQQMIMKKDCLCGQRRNGVMPFYEWVQIKGTCDFSVKKIKYNKNKKAKIRKVVLDGEIRETY